MPHELEKLFNAPAEDIMDAILKGFRAQVDVKGKLAELYLFKYLKKLLDSNMINDLIWEDKDGESPISNLVIKIICIDLNARTLEMKFIKGPMRHIRWRYKKQGIQRWDKYQKLSH